MYLRCGGTFYMGAARPDLAKSTLICLIPAVHSGAHIWFLYHVVYVTVLSYLCHSTLPPNTKHVRLTDWTAMCIRCLRNGYLKRQVELGEGSQAFRRMKMEQQGRAGQCLATCRVARIHPANAGFVQEPA
jgi:hypothetical protein